MYKKRHVTSLKIISLCIIIFINAQNCINPLADNKYSAEYFKGMNIFFMSSRNKYSREEYSRHIKKLKSIGVNSLYLITIHYSDSESSDTIKSTEETIPDSTLEDIIKFSQENGMNVILKPHIDLLNGKPRYLTKPKNFKKWIDCYCSMILKYAEISNRYNLDHFVIGTELDYIADSPFFQNSTIPQIRKLFKGKLVYSACFDHFISSSIWAHVDIIGVNAYFNLCSSQSCFESEMIDAWNYWLDIIERVSVSHQNKPVILTEVGYYSRKGTAINPGNWENEGTISYIEQEKAYNALLCQAIAFPIIKGIFWWNWELNNSWGNNSADYTPENKPAQETIRKYWYNG